MKHVKRPDGRCYFQLTTKGEPEKMQRTLFTECFYAMAMAELGRATNQEKYKVSIEAHPPPPFPPDTQQPESGNFGGVEGEGGGEGTS